jgi:hypothetical protein
VSRSSLPDARGFAGAPFLGSLTEINLALPPKSTKPLGFGDNVTHRAAPSKCVSLFAYVEGAR